MGEGSTEPIYLPGCWLAGATRLGIDYDEDEAPALNKRLGWSNQSGQSRWLIMAKVPPVSLRGKHRGGRKAAG